MKLSGLGVDQDSFLKQSGGDDVLSKVSTTIATLPPADPEARVAGVCADADRVKIRHGAVASLMTLPVMEVGGEDPAVT